MNTAKKTIYGYFGHHKCASTWFEDIFSWICNELNLKMAVFYSEKDFGGDLKRYVEEHDIDFICYANAHYRYVAPLENLVGFHCVRDPRDIIVSAYFSHLKTHPTHAWPELIAYREKLNACSKEEGLIHEIDFRAEQFEEMASWLGNTSNKILEIKMEDATTLTYQTILTLTQHLGLLDDRYYGGVERIQFLLTKILGRVKRKLHLPTPTLIHKLPAERILGIVWENEFAKKTSGRKPGEESTASHYRKGLHGDWINHLNNQHRELIKQKYNNIILGYGYETDASW